jgi:hypothetical protein
VLAVKGHGEPPAWYTLAAAAEAWGAPPWELEEHAPAIWLDRFVALRNAEADASKPKSKAGRGVTRLL